MDCVKSLVECRTRSIPDREVVDRFFSAATAAAAGALSLSSAVAVVLTGVTGAGGFIAAVVLANDETVCLGMVVVLVGVGLSAVDTAGLAVDFGGATGILGGATLAGLGGATLAAGGVLVTGVGRGVVDTALAIAGFS